MRFNYRFANNKVKAAMHDRTLPELKQASVTAMQEFNKLGLSSRVVEVAFYTTGVSVLFKDLDDHSTFLPYRNRFISVLQAKLGLQRGDLRVRQSKLGDVHLVTVFALTKSRY